MRRTCAATEIILGKKGGGEGREEAILLNWRRATRDFGMRELTYLLLVGS